MKKRLLSFVFSFAMLSFGFSQETVYTDFESGTPAGGGFGGSTYEVVANPNSVGNTSANVCMSSKTAGTPETWGGIYFPIGGTVTFSATDYTFTVDVLSDIAEVFMFKTEGGGSDPIEISADYTDVGNWQTLTFAFPTDLAAGVVNQVVAFPGFNTTNTNVWYFDNIKGPALEIGGDVDVTFAVTDFTGVSDLKMELDNDGTQIQMYDDGTNGDPTADDDVWNAVMLAMEGSNITSPGGGSYTWDVIADGAVADGADDLEFSVSSGAGTMTVSFTLAAPQPTVGYAVPFDVIGTTPTVDGVIDDVWAQATQYDIIKAFTGESFDNADDCSAYWKAGWDAFGVYILVYVTADDIHSTDGSNGQPWEQDLIEVYFDMNVGNLEDGVGASSGGTTGHYQVAQLMEPEGVVLPDWAVGSERAFVLNDDNSGVQELFIDWLDITDADGNDFTPDGTSLLGFDITIVDNDGLDSGSSRNRLCWVNDGTVTAENWANMDGAGELLCQTTVSANSVKPQISFDVFPNPVQNKVRISGLNTASEITIVNVTGATVKSLNNVIGTTIIDLSDVSYGIYFVTVSNSEGTLTQKIIKK